MRAGASVALSGLTGGSGAVAFDPILRPFVEAAAARLTAAGILAGEPWINAMTGLLVLIGGAVGMWLRLRVLARLEEAQS